MRFFSFILSLVLAIPAQAVMGLAPWDRSDPSAPLNTALFSQTALEQRPTSVRNSQTRTGVLNAFRALPRKMMVAPTNNRRGNVSVSFLGILSLVGLSFLVGPVAVLVLATLMILAFGVYLIRDGARWMRFLGLATGLLISADVVCGFQLTPQGLAQQLSDQIPRESPAHYLEILRDRSRAIDHAQAIVGLANWFPIGWDDIPDTRLPFIHEIAADPQVIDVLIAALAEEPGSLSKRTYLEAVRILAFVPIEDDARLQTIFEHLARHRAKSLETVSLFYGPSTIEVLNGMTRLIHRNRAAQVAAFHVAERIIHGQVSLDTKAAPIALGALLHILLYTPSAVDWLSTHPDTHEVLLGAFERYGFRAHFELVEALLGLIGTQDTAQTRARVGAVIAAENKKSRWSSDYSIRASTLFAMAQRFANPKPEPPASAAHRSDIHQKAQELLSAVPSARHGALLYFRSLEDIHRMEIVLSECQTPEAIALLDAALRGDDQDEVAGAANVLRLTPFSDPTTLDSFVYKLRAAYERQWKRLRRGEIDNSGVVYRAWHALEERPGRTPLLLNHLRDQLARDLPNPKKPDTDLQPETWNLIKLLNRQPDIEPVLMGDPTIPILLFKMLRRLPINGIGSEDVINLITHCPTPEMVSMVEVFLGNPPPVNFRYMMGLPGPDGGGYYYFPLRLAGRLGALRKEVALLHPETTGRTFGVPQNGKPSAPASPEDIRNDIVSGMIRYHEAAEALLDRSFERWSQAVLTLSLSSDPAALRTLTQKARSPQIGEQRALIMVDRALDAVTRLGVDDALATVSLGLEGDAARLFARTSIPILNAPNEIGEEIAVWFNDTLDAAAQKLLRFIIFIEPERLLIPDGFPPEAAPAPKAKNPPIVRQPLKDAQDPTRNLGGFIPGMRAIRLALKVWNASDLPLVEVLSHEMGHAAFYQLEKPQRARLVKLYRQQRPAFKELISAYAAEGSSLDQTDEDFAGQAYAETWRLYRHHAETLFTKGGHENQAVNAFVEEVAHDFRRTRNGKSIQRLFFPGALQKPSVIPYEDIVLNDPASTPNMEWLAARFNSLPPVPPERPKSQARHGSIVLKAT